jgi:hypothetical protein
MISYALPPEGKPNARMPKRSFLVGRPVSFHNSPTGRCTRGYVAWDVEKADKCFLKDQWRPYTKNAIPEWKIYQRLHKAGVERIATCIGGGDVGPRGLAQKTVSENVINTGRAKTLVPRVHTRLITKEIGRSLETYTDAAELFMVISHAFLGTFRLSWSGLSILSIGYSPQASLGGGEGSTP